MRNSYQKSTTGFLAIGQCDNKGEGQQDVWICHTDTLGDTLKTETLGGTDTDYGHAVVLVPQLFSAFIAGYNNSYGITESGNAYLGGVKVDMGLPEVEEECKVPRVLWVDKFVEIYPRLDPKEGEINTSAGILNKPAANDLINFSIQNEISNLVLYGVDHIFRDANQNTTGTAYKGYLSSFITQCNANGIQCTFISGYKDLEYDRASAYNSELNVAGNNYKYSGKLRYIMPEHEFWNALATSSSQHPNFPSTALPGGYTINQHYLDCYKDHKNIMDSLNIIDSMDANIWEVHDYIGYFYHRSDSSLNSYSETNTSWRAAIADTLEDLSKGIYIPYYLKFEWDSGVAFVGRNNSNGYVQLWQERISYLGKNTTKPTVIFPLFSAEYFESWTNNNYCGDDESTDFLGKYLHGPPANVGSSTNTFKKVEKLYLDQHDSIYTQTTAFPTIQNVEVNATSWFKYSCVQNKNFTDKGRNSCYLFTKNPLKIITPDKSEANPKISIYPNPSNGNVTIEFGMVDIQGLKVVDLAGDIVSYNKLTDKKSSLEIDLSSLQPGFYLIILSNQTGIFSTHKIVLTR